MTEEKLFALFQPHLFLMMLTFFSRRSKKKKQKQIRTRARGGCSAEFALQVTAVAYLKCKHIDADTHTHIYIAWTQRAHTGQTLPNPQYFNILLMRYSAFRLISILLQPELMSSFFSVETTSFPETLVFFLVAPSPSSAGSRVSLRSALCPFVTMRKQTVSRSVIQGEKKKSHFNQRRRHFFSQSSCTISIMPSEIWSAEGSSEDCFLARLQPFFFPTCAR